MLGLNVIGTGVLVLDLLKTHYILVGGLAFTTMTIKSEKEEKLNED